MKYNKFKLKEIVWCITGTELELRIVGRLKGIFKEKIEFKKIQLLTDKEEKW